MDFELDSTQRMLADSAEKLLSTFGHVGYWRARSTNASGLDPVLWSQFAELGWLALPLPEKAGGVGGSMTDLALLLMVCGRHNIVEPYISSVVLCARILETSPSQLADGLLAGIAAGETRLALAHMEVSDRYEIDTERLTLAELTDEGYLLHGEKLLSVDAPSATHLIVTATTGAGKELAILIVPSNAPGVTLNTYPLLDGSHAADVVLKAVRVDAGALVAQGAGAVAALSEAIDRSIVAQLALAVGSMERCVEICSAYLKERKQFGRAIGQFQALQHLLVEMHVGQHQSRSALYASLSALNKNAAERSRLVSLAKIAAAQSMQFVSRTGIQLHGGYGLTDEYAIGHHFRRLFVLEKSFGDIDYHFRRVASLPEPLE